MQNENIEVQGAVDTSPVMLKLERREEMGLFACDWDRSPEEQQEQPNPCYIGEQPGPG